MIGAQFDDAATGRSFRLVNHVTTLVAMDLGEVPHVLEQASLASSDGYWVGGYVSYDAAPAFDSALVARRGELGPLAFFGVFEDSQTLPQDTAVPRAKGAYSASRWTPAIDRDAYDDAFNTVKDAIRLGDTYQVNLTFPFHAAFSGEAAALYRDLLTSQHAGYGAHIWHDELHVISVSPERFFRVADGTIVTRPMKGTRPRGRWAIEDEELRADLVASEKDRAENLMIVDLIRNDLGRIATFGSVAVDELFAVERYPTVWQMTSQVSARARDDVKLVDVFGALFPCGSVTGAPKARSMEIIRDVEQTGRGVYCGAVGFIPPGDGLEGASFNVAIRTSVIDEEEGIATYAVGGGITWDSDRDGEFEEALAKAQILTAPRSTPGLFETIRWDDGYVWMDEHLERFARSANFLSIRLPMTELTAALDSLGQILDQPTKVRVSASSEGEIRVTTDPAPARFAMGSRPESEAVAIEVDFDPIDERDFRIFHKTTDRAVYDSRKRRHPGADEVLMTNRTGHITEGTVSNVAVLIDGRWLTPPLDDGLLDGIMRGQLLAVGRLEEASISVTDLKAATAIAVFNSVRGWRPAVLNT